MTGELDGEYGEPRLVESVRVPHGWLSQVAETREDLEAALQGVWAKSARRVITADIIAEYAQRVSGPEEWSLRAFRVLVEDVGWEAVGPDCLEALFGAGYRGRFRW